MGEEIVYHVFVQAKYSVFNAIYTTADAHLVNLLVYLIYDKPLKVISFFSGVCWFCFLYQKPCCMNELKYSHNPNLFHVCTALSTLPFHTVFVIYIFIRFALIDIGKNLVVRGHFFWMCIIVMNFRCHSYTRQ